MKANLFFLACLAVVLPSCAAKRNPEVPTAEASSVRHFHGKPFKPRAMGSHEHNQTNSYFWDEFGGQAMSPAAPY